MKQSRVIFAACILVLVPIVPLATSMPTQAVSPVPSPSAATMPAALSPELGEEANVATPPSLQLDVRGVVAAVESTHTPGVPMYVRMSHYWPAEVARWEKYIVAWAEQYQIDPDLLAAMMLMESGGNPVVISKSGACGLMQVMARDTSNVKPWLFKDRPTCNELGVPDFNIGWATHYLAGLYQHYGNWRDAVKHYGPMDVAYSYADRVIGLWETSKNE